MAIELPEGYYLDNFQKLIDFVYRQYSDLLTEPEKALSVDFQKLPLDAQRLYVRLISRKGPYFRSDKLQYSEISSIPQMLEVLAEADFVAINPEIDMEILLNLLVRQELLELDTTYTKGWRSFKKPALVEHFLQAENKAALVKQMTQWFSWIEPLRLRELLIYRLCFFGNLRQDLTEFVLLDLGVMSYENYQIHQEDRYFQGRVLLDNTLQMLLLRELAEDVLASKDIQTILDYFQLLPHHGEDDALKRRHNRLTNTLARQLERLGAWPESLQLYQQSDHPPARERQARILAQQDKLETALALCIEIKTTPFNEEELEFAEKFQIKLQKKLGQPVHAAHVPDIVESEWNLPFSELPVELQVVEFLESQKFQAFYVENHLWKGLFGLAFWDILFMPVRGAFFNLYQRGPADLFSDEFRRKRQSQIEKRLQCIQEDKAWPDMMLQTFREKYNISNYLVYWPKLSEELIQICLERIPRYHFTSIFDRLSWDLRANDTGFPDLIAFPEHHGYELIEVKAPGDRLQQNQKRWIRYFTEYGIPYRVVYVTYH